MQFTRSKKYDFPPEFTIGGSEILDVKKEHTILRVVVQSDLKWQSHCQEMVRRATSTTWALRRMRALGVPQATLVEYWKAEGRVRLEYGCPVWHSGLTSAQSHSLDRAQRAAMAAITGRWEPSHPAAGQFRAGETFGQKDKVVQDIRPAHGHKFETYGHVHPCRQRQKTGDIS